MARRARGREITAVERDAKGDPRARVMWRFCLVFLVLVCAFSWVTSARSSGEPLHEALSRTLAKMSVPVLSLFGSATADERTLVFRQFSASIEGACDGVQPTLIYLAAVLAFPSRWRAKAWGVLIGVPAIFLVNFVRIVTVMLCGAYRPEWFERVHLYGWQALVIAFTLAVWLFWIERFVRGPSRSPA